MKTLLTILIAVVVAFGQYGTIDMSRYTSLIDKIGKMYKPYAKAYNDTAKVTQYVFDFPEILGFPYDCTTLSRDSAGQTVYINPYGGILKSRTDSYGIEHVQIPTISYVAFKGVTSIKYLEMHFYKADSTGVWTEEKKPLKVNLYYKGDFYSCEN